ncbi:filamentous hemagglutinin N-terminal domain-containing protein [Phormidium sp. FACHB-592]|uniref:Filamentous hemagglutinin N-terminal domain-containing protein n=1 Tax=Stenomitos frigidus AS-A4 TaxID=2933935 RepID=A0ABV0KQ12_9CYAN|nr:filamentous hemagglutinin N-terminal domain-containing protein [Phormidium sp. FACHB-592]MBD2075654.1 filamentous hemagglutinin N-terminal domain-containing protein [Phormidium sp. FACHB-592]
MTKFSLLNQGWQLKLVGSVAITGALLLPIKESLAQIVPDNTLGAESSVVTPNLTIRGIQSDRIDSGAIRGTNLFHSFSQFNIGAGRGVYFANPAGIDNILARITGANQSNILGRLGVLGTANLFLINPNGIVFGSAASLDVQGSFVATTANAVKLGDTGLFSASQPATSNLLSVSPSALWFNAVAAQPIVNRSQASSSFGQRNSAGLNPGLQVRSDRTLALVGGDVLLDGGRLTAAQGRIELSSVAGVGQVSLSQSGNDFVLGYDSVSNFSNIKLSNGAIVDASGVGGGDVQIRGERLEMAQGSNIWADTLGTQNGGGVLVRATEVFLSEGSSLTADVAGAGTGGDLRIDTGRLLVRDGAQVSVGTFGTGKSGNLQIRAGELIELIGTSADGRAASGLFAVNQGSGNAGNVSIDTGRLLARDGAVVSVNTFGAGKGGNLQIRASELIELIGISANGRVPSALLAQSEGSGDAGELRINTQRLLVQSGAQVAASTFGTGKGGNLQITAAQSVELIGATANNRFASGLFAVSQGSGNAGNVTIDTRRLLVSDGGQILVNTLGFGKGGSLQITAAESVEVIRTSANGRVPSSVSAKSEGSGDAGELRINTRRLRVQDGAQVGAGTFGQGKGGSLQITAAESVELIGATANGQFPSGLFTQSQGSGNAGALTIDTGRLVVRDGAVVSASTFGQGKGGRLLLKATDLVELTGTRANGPGGLFTVSNGSGNAGDALRIDAGRLLVRDGAVISSRSIGEGTAGNIDITVRDTLEANNGTIQTNTIRSAGGAITINAGAIRLFSDSDIVSNVASGEGGGGDINMKADSILAFGDSDILAFSRDGRGGNINLDTPAFFGEHYRPAPRNTNPATLEGNDRVDVNATGTIASGTILLPDTTFIQNSLTELPENQINTDSILASSCIVRRNQPTQGRFTITGAGGLPQRPGDVQMSSFPTVDMETLPSDSTALNSSLDRPWQKGDPIVEPQGVYQLSNGKLVMSRECH